MPRRLSSRPTTKPKRRNEKSERQYDRKKEKTEILSPNARKKLELQQALKDLENSTPSTAFGNDCQMAYFFKKAKGIKKKFSSNQIMQT